MHPGSAASATANPGAGASPDAGDPVPAALAGSVVRLLVKVGDVVGEGQPVLILEAMKMETEVAASRSGTVTAVHVQEGDTVAVGEPLVSIG